MKKSAFTTLFLFIYTCFCLAQTPVQPTETLFLKDERGSTGNVNTNNTNLNWSDMSYEERKRYEEWARDDRAKIEKNRKETENTAQNTSNQGAAPMPVSPAYTKLVNAAVTKFQRKHYAMCLDFCAMLLEMNPDDTEVLFLKATCHYFLNDKDAGLKYMKIAAEKGSKDAKEMLKQINKQ